MMLMAEVFYNSSILITLKKLGVEGWRLLELTWFWITIDLTIKI